MSLMLHEHFKVYKSHQYLILIQANKWRATLEVRGSASARSSVDSCFLAPLKATLAPDNLAASHCRHTVREHVTSVFGSADTSWQRSVACHNNSSAWLMLHSLHPSVCRLNGTKWNQRLRTHSKYGSEWYSFNLNNPLVKELLEDIRYLERSAESALKCLQMWLIAVQIKTDWLTRLGFELPSKCWLKFDVFFKWNCSNFTQEIWFHPCTVWNKRQF